MIAGEKKTKKRIYWSLGLISGTVVMLVIAFLMFSMFYDRKQEMIDIVRQWGRLAAFPVVSEKIDIQTNGNMFTRTFSGSFVADRQTVERWEKDSPGIQDAAIENLSDGKVKYVISPGSGAGFAQVIIDHTTGKVEFTVSWN